MRIGNGLFAFAALILAMTAACQPQNADPVTENSMTQETNDWWQPEPGLTWQIQYTGEIDPSLNVDVYNLDLFETSAEVVDALHARGVRVICYLNAGSWEDWRPDREDFPEAALGREYAGWPGERWLDIRQIEILAPLMNARLDLCAEKGFDGVDPDNLDGYINATGFDLTSEDQLAYNRWLADAAHTRGLGIGLKNDPDQVIELVDAFDWTTVESCFHEGWCAQTTPFIEAGKPVFAIEYTDNGMTTSDFCDQAADLSIDALLKHRQLDGWLATCP
jgi:endo-alpha-1,4-polygalactosaminidase (GH114 family)